MKTQTIHKQPQPTDERTCPRCGRASSAHPFLIDVMVVHSDADPKSRVLCGQRPT